MRERLIQASAYFESLSLRERLLVLFAVLFVLSLVVWMVWFVPVQNQTRALEKGLTSLMAEQKSLETSVDQLQQRLQRDPDREVKQQIRQLEARVKKQRNEIAAFRQVLLPSDSMGRALEDMLAQTKGLSLVRLANQPAKALQSNNRAHKEDVADKGSSVYKHPLELEFSGSYLQVVAYLQQVEQRKLPLYWDRFLLTVDSYPKATIAIEVYSISLTPGWVRI